MLDNEDRLVAVGHSGGIALVGPSGSLATVIESKQWPRVVRSTDGWSYLSIEGKMLSVLDSTGRLRAVVEFSRSIADAVFTATHLVIAAGKLVSLDVVEASRA